MSYLKNIPTGISAAVLKQAFSRINREEFNQGSLTIDLKTANQANATDILTLQGSEQGAQGYLSIHNPFRMLGRMALSGSLGVGESYMAGEWSAGNGDLTGTMQSVLSNDGAFRSFLQGNSALRTHLNNRNKARFSHSQASDAESISEHYDDKLIAQFTGNTKTYTSGLRLRDCPTGQDYGVPGNDHDSNLDDWQMRKVSRVLHKLNPQYGENILEIGCGYGTLGMEAAKRGFPSLGITLSIEQLEHAQKTAQAEGLNDLAKFRYIDYRDLAQEPEKYKHIMSVGMAEHVGDMNEYMGAIHDMLTDDGHALVHLITLLTNKEGLDQYNDTLDFIQAYIFSNGKLTNNETLVTAANNNGLSLKEHFNFGHSYGDTLVEWHKNFQGAWTQLEIDEKLETGKNEIYTSKEKNKWEFYLCSCAAAFYADKIDVNHFHLTKEPTGQQAPYLKVA